MTELRKNRIRKHVHNLVKFQLFGLDTAQGRAAGWGFTLAGKDYTGFKSQDEAVEAAHREIEARK